jgi:uncharacterized damage-inducible protein DinB
MPILDAILAELAHESGTTVKVLERVPEDKLDWTPHPKSTPIGKLAWHIAVIPSRVHVMVRDGELDVMVVKAPPRPDTVAEIVAGYNAHIEQLRAYLSSIDDSVLKEPFTMRAGDKIIAAQKKIVALRAILLNHTYHHRGQLSVYLRLLDVPVPGIYGPTADEPLR